ncbi:MAG: hypothetical protein J3Q66DRAFT_336099 [Benniella sp.]|nr:MAG: hypothetical protein J3Q66DRAFT_336099 [Benniella sp.]
MAESEYNAQIFRLRSSHESTSIPTRLDIKSGQRVVLWKDVLQYFKHAEGVLNEGKAVLFLTDDNFEYLTPLRIPCYPGIVLEVVGNNAPWDTVSILKDEAVVPTKATSLEPRIQDCMSPPFAGKSLHMELSTLSLLETTDGDDTHIPFTIMSADIESAHPEDQPEDIKATAATGTDNPLQMVTVTETPDGPKDGIQTPCETNNPSHSDNSDTESMGDVVVQSESMAVYTDSSIRAYYRLYKLYVRAANDGRTSQATAIECAMSKLFNKLEIEMGKIRDIHQQLVQTQDSQIGTSDIQQQSVVEEQQFDHPHVEMEEHRQQSPSSQQQYVEEELETEKLQLSFQQQPTGEEQEQDPSVQPQLPDIQDHVKAMLNQNYELHEYPYPRLFIVLPTEVHAPDKIVKPLAGQFRLYFLCDCGAHTMPGNSPTFHQVHLVVHKGYDILKPVEFFDKYGRYVLIQMNMIKHGIRVPELVVPSLENSKIAQALNMTQERLESLVDDSIKFLQDLLRGKNEDSIRLDKTEVLDGGKRRQLRWYLDVNGDDHGFGNLYRIVTRSGHVKWACKDHFIANNPDSTMQEYKGSDNSFGPDLREMRRLCYDDFDRIWGGGSVIIRSVQKFRVTILGGYGHQPSLYSQLLDALNRTNTVDLALNGLSYSCKQYDCDPVMQSMSNGRLQSLRFLSNQDMVWSIRTSSINKAPKMRVLELQMPIDIESKPGMSYLRRILECCSNLVYLGLRLKEQVSLVKVMTTVIPKLKKLERLEIFYGHFYTATDISHCNVKTLQIHLPFIKHHDFEDAKPNFTEDLDETLGLDQLVEILYQKPAISDIKFGYRESDHLDIINAIIATRQETLPERERISPRLRLELVSVWDRLHASTSITMEFKESGIETDVRISEWEQPYSAMYINFFRNYGWSIKTLDVMNGSIDDSLAQLLDKTTGDKGTKLESLVLDLKSLSFAGLQTMDRVFRRSQGLRRLAVICAASDFEHDGEKTQWFLEQYGKTLTGLYLRGPDPEALTPWLKQFLPSREALPVLNDLQLRFHGSPEFQYSSPFIKWLVGMISAVSSKPAHNSTDGSRTANWSPLQRLYLNDFKPYNSNFPEVLGVIDFSTLEELDLKSTSFSNIQSLVNYIGRVNTVVPLKVLNLSDTYVSKNWSTTYESQIEMLRKKAPSVSISGLSRYGIH